MRKLSRPLLDSTVAADLASRQATVDRSASPSKEVTTEWKKFRGASKAAVRETLETMASGLSRCMYCEDSMGTDIDHFRPKVKYPSSGFVWSNMYLACSHCNSNQKREEFPEVNGAPQLIDPAEDSPWLHLAFSPTTGQFEPLTEKGRLSCDVFGLNREICALGRKDAWVAICVLVAGWNQLQTRGDSAQADNILTALRHHPFQALMRVAVTMSALDIDDGQMPLEARNAFRAHQVLRELAD